MVDVWKDLGRAIGAALKPLAELGALLWTNLATAAQPLAEGFAAAVKGVQDAAGPLFKPIGDAILAGIQEAMAPGTLDKETAEKAKAAADEFKKKQETALKKMYKSPAALTMAPAVAAEILAGLLGSQVVVEAGGAAADAAHPGHKIGFQDLAKGIMNSLGISALASTIATMPSTIALITPLRYWYNTQFMPLIPGSSELLSLRARGIIDDAGFKASMAAQGFSAAWADNLLTGSYVIPGFRDLQVMLWRESIDEDKLRNSLAAAGV